jgi:excisionase family DNA binding protein
MAKNFSSLRRWLLSQQAGPISDAPALERLLAACWDEFLGDDGSMEGHKLPGRVKEVSWTPPKLAFSIERHGGTVMGSSRAELQHWEVDLEKRTATLTKTGHRQLRPMARRIYTRPLVDRILAAIRSGGQDQVVSRHDDGTISLNTRLIFPDGSAFRMTLEGRRKRLREAVAGVLLEEGWERLGMDSFRPPTGGKEGCQAASLARTRHEEPSEAKLDSKIGMPGQGPAYVAVKGAMRITGLSDSHIRRAIHAGQLPASNMGTGRRPLWRIALKDLDEWMERKKGGTTAVPPKSELGDLIDRHLPGLRGRNDSATR